MLFDRLFLEFPYEGKSFLQLFLSFFSIDGQLHSFIRKFYEGKIRILVVGYSYLFCQYEMSPFSGKIIPSLKIERMSLNLLAIWPKNKIEMQTIYDGR